MDFGFNSQNVTVIVEGSFITNNKKFSLWASSQIYLYWSAPTLTASSLTTLTTVTDSTVLVEDELQLVVRPAVCNLLAVVRMLCCLSKCEAFIYFDDCWVDVVPSDGSDFD